jgi:hypothetical protein
MLRRTHGAGKIDAVTARRRRRRGEFLHVVGHDDAADRALGSADAHGLVDDVPRLHRRYDHLRVVADVLEHRQQIHLLLKLAAEGTAGLLADNGHHRHVIHLRIVEPGQQMQRAGPRGGHADANLASELGMRRGHERSHFLVAHAHVVEAVAGAPHRAHQAVDAVAGVAEDALDAPVAQPLQNVVADGHAAHENLLLRRPAARRRMKPTPAPGADAASPETGTRGPTLECARFPWPERPTRPY